MMLDVRTDRGRTESIVGREAELADLLRSAASPTTRMVLLSGDAGQGKTRLVSEALAHLRADGWTGLIGHCLDFGESAVPYLPLAEVLGQVAEQEPDLAAAMDRTHPALSRLRRAGSGATGTDRPETLDRVEVFEAVHALLDELTERTPVVLVVEDAHWADTSTRDLLSFLLSRRFRGRLLLVVTYRSDEMHRRHPLRQRTAEWVRVAGVERVQLEPLAPSAVRTMVEALVAGPGGVIGPRYDDDIARIVARAQGNAFYVEELAAAFLGGGWSLPEDLADLLLVRLDRLDETARQLVRVASASGQRVSHDVLATVAGLSPDVLDLALRDAIEAHVLEQVGDSSYSFRHALLGEAVYDDLLPGERMRLHTSYAEAVREVCGPEGAPELARHALASHDLPTALTASVAAGRAALESGGPDEAAEHFTKALEIYPRAAPELPDPPDESQLVALTVEALCEAGRPETAVSLVEQHLVQLPADTPDRTRAALLLAYVDALRSTEPEEDPYLFTTEALQLVGPEPTPLRARILATHALAMIWADRFQEAREYADEALELAEQVGESRAAADASLTLTWLNQHLDRGEGSRVELRRIITEAQSRGDKLSELRGFLRMGAVELEYGDLARSQEAFLTANRLASGVGRPWILGGISGRTQAGIVAYLRGEWDEALAIVDHSREDPPAIPRAMLDCVVMLVAAGRGRTDALKELASLRERWHREGMVAVNAGGAAIELLGRRDGAAAALAAYDDLVGVLKRIWGPHFDALVRLATQTTSALADEAPRTATGARADVLAAADRLRADAEAALTSREADQRPFGIEGQAWVARLRAERLRLEWLLGESVDLAELERAWRLTEELFAQLGQVHEVARARTRLAAILRATGEVEAAREAAQLAREVASRLGAQPLLDALGELTSRGHESQGPFTPREEEILQLVAAGRSNGEIGTQLFISAKTVSVHVSNVMAKLGAASRTEAVALARQRGLLPG